MKFTHKFATIDAEPFDPLHMVEAQQIEVRPRTDSAGLLRDTHYFAHTWNGKVVQVFPGDMVGIDADGGVHVWTQAQFLDEYLDDGGSLAKLASDRDAALKQIDTLKAQQLVAEAESARLKAAVAAAQKAAPVVSPVPPVAPVVEPPVIPIKPPSPPVVEEPPPPSPKPE